MGQPLVVVAAEDYKRQRKPLRESELYDDHFDRVEIYPPYEIDLIITDNEIVVADKTSFPSESWERVIQARCGDMPDEAKVNGRPKKTT